MGVVCSSGRRCVCSVHLQALAILIVTHGTLYFYSALVIYMFNFIKVKKKNMSGWDKYMTTPQISISGARFTYYYVEK